MSRLSNIKDPKVIQLCDKHGFLLVTTDREMRTTFIEVLKTTEIGVLATANNNHGDDVWVERIIGQKVKILRHFKKEQRPYFSVIQSSGHIKVETLLPAMTTRRTRPKERDLEIGQT